MSFVFSSRHVELVRRLLITVAYEFQNFSTKDLNHFYDTDYERYDTTFGDFSVKFQCSLDEEEAESLNQADIMIFCRNTCFLTMPFYYFSTKELFLYDVIQEIFKNENRVFRKCKIEYCDELCFCKEEHYCKQDYIYYYIHEDKCCVCLENGGSWTKLECNHFIHTACVKKLESYITQTITCPLCKHMSTTKSLQKNYLFLQ